MSAKNISIPILCLIFCFFASIAFGCLYTVRDVGFVDIYTAPYQLCYYVQNHTSQDAINTFKQVSYAALANSNVEFRIINIDQKTDKHEPAIRYVGLLGIKSFPTAVLVSPKGWIMTFPDFTNNSSKESIWSVMDGIVKSPVRDEILKHIVKSHSIVLLIQGKNTVEANEKANTIITESIKEIGKTMSQMPKSIEEPPFMITITPEKFAQEKILLWSLGLDLNEIDKPYFAILYGKGRQIGNVLEGEKITVNAVYNTLALAGSSCECDLDKRWLYGNMIPLRWDEKKHLEAVKLLGFDPENPLVKTEISQVLAMGPSWELAEFPSMEYDGEMSQSLKYSESIAEFENTSRTLSPVQIRRLTSSDSSSKEESKTNIIEIKDEKIQGDKKEQPKPEEKTINNTKAELSPKPSPRSVVMASADQKETSDQVNKGSLNSVYLNTLVILGVMFLVTVAGGLFVFLRTKKKI